MNKDNVSELLNFLGLFKFSLNDIHTGANSNTHMTVACALCCVWEGTATEMQNAMFYCLLAVTF